MSKPEKSITSVPPLRAVLSRIRNRLRQGVALFIALAVVLVSLPAQADMEIITLRYRSVEQVLPSACARLLMRAPQHMFVHRLQQRAANRL